MWWPKQRVCMMNNSEASGCVMTSHGGGESLDNFFAKQTFTDSNCTEFCAGEQGLF